MADYPKRESHWAHKLVRLMLRSCAAQDMGADGVLLVVAIAHTEDAKRYCGAVTFWNEQLMPILGFTSWGQLDRARDKAVAAGWLHYECGGKRKVGRYWTTIPADITDETDADLSCDYHGSIAKSGDRTGGEVVIEPGENRGRSGDRTEGEVVILLPSPSPSPSPTEKKDSSEPPNTAASKPAVPEPIAGHLPEAPCVGPVKSWRVTEAKLAEWRESFSTLDVDAEIRKAIQWLKDNPAKRKTAGGMSAFVGRWLTKATDCRAGPPSGGNGRTFNGNPDPRGTFAAGAAWLASKKATVNGQ